LTQFTIHSEFGGTLAEWSLKTPRKQQKVDYLIVSLKCDMDTIHIHQTRSIANHFFWILLLQGALAILIAFLVIIYPPVIVPLIAAMFLWQGLTALFLAWRVRKFWKEVPELFS
jgi:hypothetical protein